MFPHVIFGRVPFRPLLVGPFVLLASRRIQSSGSCTHLNPSRAQSHDSVGSALRNWFEMECFVTELMDPTSQRRDVGHPLFSRRMTDGPAALRACGFVVSQRVI